MNYNEAFMKLNSMVLGHKEFSFDAFRFWRDMVMETIRELEKQKDGDPFVLMQIHTLNQLKKEVIDPLLVKNPKNVEESLREVRESLIEVYKSAFG